MTYILNALRTPIGTENMAFAHVDAPSLAAPVIAHLAHGIDTAAIDQIVMGNVRGPGGNPARVAGLQADIDIPAVSVDRQCGSGLAAVEIGHAMVTAGARYVIAGGMQSASTQPRTFWKPGRDPRHLGQTETDIEFDRPPFAPTGLPDPSMGIGADALAQRAGISRARQDAYAARSHQRAWASVSDGVFSDEIVEIAQVSCDQRPRPGMTVERLARFRPSFSPDGTATAANSCGVSDAAAGVLLAHERPTHMPALKILACLSATCSTEIPGWGIVPAVRRALDYAGVDLRDIDVVEFNEAFAGQTLACLDALGIDETANCTQGGAIGLGHPWAASGAILAVRLFSQMIRQGRGRYGLAAMGIGGGQGSALVVEACRNS